MAHDASKVQLGSTRSSFKVVTNRAGSIAAGKAVRLKSDDTISTAKADGSLLGVSIGRGMSDIARTAIVREGDGVPLLLTDGFTPTIGAQVNIDDVTGLAKAAGAGVTAVNATYETGALTGIDEDGAEVRACTISMPGGL